MTIGDTAIELAPAEHTRHERAKQKKNDVSSKIECEAEHLSHLHLCLLSAVCEYVCVCVHVCVLTSVGTVCDHHPHP